MGRELQSRVEVCPWFEGVADGRAGVDPVHRHNAELNEGNEQATAQNLVDGMAIGTDRRLSSLRERRHDRAGPA